MKNCRSLLIFLLCTGVAQAALVSQDEVRRAVEGFLAHDAIGSQLLAGHTLAALEPRDAQWLARLAPAGYVVVSGSDLCEPITAFSAHDFVEPAAGSPFATVLAGAAAGARKVELLQTESAALQSVTPLAAAGAADARTAARRARWTALTSSATLQSLVSPLPSDATTIVPPFLTTHWSQGRPYSDFAPVYDSSSSISRCPCGCVATAAAQGFRYWQWPARLDTTWTYDHAYYINGTTSTPVTCTLRFDGRVPLDWTGLKDSYGWITETKSTHSSVAEATRLPVARLILWCDVLAKMYFSKDGSGANFSRIANQSPWYETPTTVYPWRDFDNATALMRADLEAGAPLQVSIPGHAIVGHGWAEDSSTKYIYLNYGWGGSCDGWYNLDDTTSEDAIEDAVVGFRPRKTAQLDPLPAVCSLTDTLSWHVPPCHTNNIASFTVTTRKPGTAVTTRTDDLSAPQGTSSGGWYLSSSASGTVAPALKITGSQTGTYTLNERFLLTGRSYLTFRTAGYYTYAKQLTAQIKLDNGDWQTVDTPFLNADGTTDWKTRQIFLGAFGGQTAQIRFSVTYDNRPFYSSGYILLDDLQVTDVITYVASTQTVPGTTRSLALADCGVAAGESCLFAVQPVMTDGSSSEASALAATSIAGTGRRPAAGTLTYSSASQSCTADTLGTTWSVANCAVSDATIQTGSWSGSATLPLVGAVTADSVFSFAWKACGYYGNSRSYDTFTARFTDDAGTATTLWTTTNAADQSDFQTVTLPLAQLAGKTGILVLSFSHRGSQYTSSGYGATFQNLNVTLLRVGTPPASVTWQEVRQTALGTPAITGVSSATPAFAEGFYREAAIGTNVFEVTCSSSVVSLAAYPSHLSLVADTDVTVHPLGGGRFAVEVNPRGLDAATSDCSRTILTLEAKDANGTAAYKDLVLRFNSTVAAQTYSNPTVVITDGTLTAEIPQSWLISQGFASAGASEATFRAAAYADADGDGLANWQEYVCNTNPKNASDKLLCHIAFEKGVLQLSCTPAVLLTGYRAVFQGRVSLAGTDTWSTADTSRHTFFRVIVEAVP